MARPTRHYDKWRIRPLDHTGRRLSLTYNTYSEADAAIKQIEAVAAQIRRGLTPSQSLADISPALKPLNRKTFTDLSDVWKENKKGQKRSYKDDVSILNRHLIPHFGILLVSQIQLQHVEEYVKLKSELKLNIKTIHNHLTLLITMLNYGKDLGWVKEIPKIRKPRIHLLTTDYRYLKTDEEISQFLEAAKMEGAMVFALYATAIYTGMRAGELAGLKWCEVDLTRRLIHIKASYTGPTKSGRNRYVPILNRLLPVLTAWRQQNPLEYVFPNGNGTMLTPSARQFQEVLHRVLENARFPSSEKDGKNVRYIRFHDLRHTFASVWTAKGGSREKLQRLLGHSSSLMTDRYTHLAPEVYTSDWGRM